MTSNSTKSTPIDGAPPEVKLAVDLIYLLESNRISVEIALAAIKIVEKDLQQKLQKVK